MKMLPLLLFPFLVSCANPSTPEGHEGYCTQSPVFASSRFYSAQVGPISTGMGWMLGCTNVDYRWATFSEEFEVMSSDNLALKFNSHLVIRPKQGSIKEIVENYGGPDWYTRSLQQPLRNAVYEAVAGYKALEAKDRREEISHKANVKFSLYLQGKPFEVQNLIIGAVQFPQAVAVAQEQRIAKETELSRKEFEVDIAKKDALVRIEEAKGIAESQRIINATLTQLYLQHEAIKAQERMAASPNHTTVYIPSGANGIPLVQDVSKDASKNTIRGELP